MSNEKTVESVEGLVDHGKKHNRSSAPSPEMMAEITAQTSAAVQEAVQASVAAVFASLAPMLESLALTKEKIQELKAPFIDPKVAAREKREAQMNREQIEEMNAAIAWRQSHCLHQDANGKDIIAINHNWTDRNPRGICMRCSLVIHPKEWRIGAPDPITGKSQAYIVEAHRDYPRVLAIDAQLT
jgi:hypothetical protein